MQLLTDYPWYFLLFCLLAGGGYAWALYGLGRRRNADMPRWARVTLPLLRFAGVTAIAFLLLSPLVKRQVHEKERPIVVVAEDVSGSVTAHGYALAEEQWAPVLRELEKDYDVVRYGYAREIIPEKPDNPESPATHFTNISAALTDLKDRYAGRNLAAVVLTGDGLYNQGQNPMGVAPTLAVPLYTVALGDTTLRRDAAIATVRCNRIAYMGNRFPVEVTVRATRLAGHRSTLSLRQGDRTLASQPLAYEGESYAATVTLVVDAEKAGLQSYTLVLAPDEAEYTTRNNSRTIVVEVIDGHQKIALLAAAPHPDIAALRAAIGQNPNYAVDLFLPAQLATMKPSQLQDYSLLVLHNLPIASGAADVLVRTAVAQLPTIFIVGTRTDLGRLNALHSGLEIVARTKKVDEVSATRNQAFSLFTLDEELGRRLEQMPPLQAPFGDYRLAANGQSLFDATIGGVATGRPLVAFGQQEGVRRAFVAGEGLWRWRLHSYQATGSHDDFNTLVEKMVVYTSLQVGKERFRVTTQPVYSVAEPVQLEAELYNDNYEPVNTPEVTLTLTPLPLPGDSGPSGKSGTSSYTFNRSGDNYLLRLGALPAGTYAYAATTTFNGKEYKATGRFAVDEVNLEEVTLVADHALMNTLAVSTGGTMLAPDSLARLPELLAARDDIRSVIYSHTRYTDLLNVPWVLVLIVLLFALEWGIRKYYL